MYTIIKTGRVQYKQVTRVGEHYSHPPGDSDVTWLFPFCREGQEPSYTYPPTFTRRLVDQRVLPGRTARFECLMLGIPLPDVEW